MHKFRKNLIIALALLNAILPLTPILTVTLQSFNVAAAGTADNAVQDSKLPFSTVSINDGTSYTRDSLVDVKVKLSPSASKTKLLSARFLLCNWHDECQSMHPDHPYWSDWRNVDTFGKVNSSGEIEFSVKQVLSNPQVEGKKNVCVQVQDTKGNISPYACDYIYLDTSAPTGSLSINGGATSTDSLNLTLNLSAADPKLQAGTKYEINGAGNLKYSLSTDGSNWTAWSKLADLHSATKDIAYSFPGNLTNPTEIVMYVKYADRLGNESLTYSDSIWYGTPTTPVSPPTQGGSGSILINNGEVFTASQVVTLNLKTSGSKPTSMKVWNRGENSDAVAKVPYSENVSWTLSAGYETKQVYAQFFYANNQSTTAVVDEITYAPVYGISYHDAIPGNAEHTLSSMPSSLITGQNFDLTLQVHNFGSMTWPQNGSNPVQIAYHWVRADGTSYLFEGTRTNLNQNLPYQQHDANIRLKITAPTEPGNYILQIDAVHHGHTWFSWSGNAPLEYQVEVFNSQVPGFSSTQNVLSTDVNAQAYTRLYMVQFPSSDQTWRCGGHDCLTAIAEQMYQCSARGIPNFDSTGTAPVKLREQCWWPIFAANPEHFRNVPKDYQDRPWSYLLPGQLLKIPGMTGRVIPGFVSGVLPMQPNGFTSYVNNASVADPYGGMNAAVQAWPEVSIDRFSTFFGLSRVERVKWSETKRPNAPTISSMQISPDGASVTVYGVALPKGHPMAVKVWNEFRYCIICGSGWDYHYQQATAHHVKVVLWKNNWEYLGEVWSDSPDGRWQINLPLGTLVDPGTTIYAEVQIEGDYTFHGLRDWGDRADQHSFNLNLRDPKYFGHPYFASSTSNRAIVPMRPMTVEQWAIHYREAYTQHKSFASELHQICGAWVKDYNYLTDNADNSFTYTNLIYNPKTNWAHRLRGWMRLVYWDNYQGPCGELKLPTSDDMSAAKSEQGTTGAYQTFDNGTMYSSRLGTHAVVGKLNELHNQQGGTGGVGFPTSDKYIASGFSCQAFESGEICESISICKPNEVWDTETEQCVDKKTLECRSKSMVKYVNPNNPSEVVCARINNFPYINQALNSAGTGYSTPGAGTVMCGANAVVMAAAGLGKIPQATFDQLKEYTYQDKGVVPGSPAKRHCNFINDVFRQGASMYNISGAFSFTGNDWESPTLSMCATNIWGYMDSYLKGFGLDTSGWVSGENIQRMGKDEYMRTLREIIDKDGGAIQGLAGKLNGEGYEHIILIKGYTDDGRIIVNDSWTNILSGSINYSLNGNGAIYNYSFEPIMSFGSRVLFKLP